MLTRTHRMFAITLLLLTPAFTFLGCEIDDGDDVIIVDRDNEAPAIPRGVISVTGDESVTVEWFPNGELDLAGYRIWRGQDNVDFDLLKEVSTSTTRFVDVDVRNGWTYYYAVSTFDFDGNESDLSPEEVADTPRPSGRNVTLRNFAVSPTRSGFDLSRPSQGAIPWDTLDTDIYFGVDTSVSDTFVYENVKYLYSDNGTLIQDMGYHEDFDAVDISPVNGFIGEFVELVEGHIYVLNSPDNNFAKIHVIALSDDAVTFDWAYQTDPDNPQLAPPLHQP